VPAGRRLTVPAAQAKEYREKVEKELRDICNDVLVSLGRRPHHHTDLWPARHY
jgi:hypothetical protein